MHLYGYEAASLPLIGDCIGCESCVEVMPLIGGTLDADSADKDRNLWVPPRLRHVTHHQVEYPPPIPLLARIGNLRWHMPWVLIRHYTSDGRLILREERVSHLEHFRAHRSGDRLTLQLVSVEDDGFELPINADDNPDDDENDVSDNYLRSKEDVYVKEDEDIDDGDGDNNNGADFDDDDNKEQLSSVSENTKATLLMDNVGSGSGDQWKSCLYNTMSPSSSCIFRVAAVHALGPVLG